MIIKNLALQVLDILIVWILLYQIIKFLKNTRAVQMFRGFIVFFILTIIAGFMHLFVVEWIFKSLWTVSVFLFVIVFQPEIRRALAEVGKQRIYKINFSINNRDIIFESIKLFSSKKTGALIVFEKTVGLKNFIENGIVLNAEITTELLHTIFFQNTPLHDGAVIIQNNTVASAASFLPLTKQEMSKTVGSRHRAGLGISEITDAFVIIVSEETGNISLAIDGQMLWNIDYEKFKDIFNEFWDTKNETFFNKTLSALKNSISLKNLKNNFYEKMISFILSIIIWYYIKYMILT